MELSYIFSKCSIEQKKKIYNVLVKIFHPDTGGDEEVFKKINDIYHMKPPAPKKDTPPKEESPQNKATQEELDNEAWKHLFTSNVNYYRMWLDKKLENKNLEKFLNRQCLQNSNQYLFYRTKWIGIEKKQEELIRKQSVNKLAKLIASIMIIPTLIMIVLSIFFM